MGIGEPVESKGQNALKRRRVCVRPQGDARQGSFLSSALTLVDSMMGKDGPSCAVPAQGKILGSACLCTIAARMGEKMVEVFK